MGKHSVPVNTGATGVAENPGSRGVRLHTSSMNSGQSTYTPVQPADRLRAEQFGKGKHAKITPAAIGSQPIGSNSSPLPKGRHAAGPVNNKGNNIGTGYTGSHAGAPKTPALPKHASNAPAGAVKLKDKTALRAIEAGAGY
jgi:hypothetical protein